MASVVIAAAYGGPEVLTVIDEPAREPGPGQARIEVRAAGVNPVDYKVYSGAFGRDPASAAAAARFEAAGVITQVGPDAVGPAGPLLVGDEVIAYRASGALRQRAGRAGPVLWYPSRRRSTGRRRPALMLTGVTAWH